MKYPYLYCGNITTKCPVKMPDEADCPHEMYLTEEMGLATRLLQFIHRDLEKQK